MYFLYGKGVYCALHQLIWIMHKDEIALIQEVQNGNLDSFTSLYNTYFQRIYSFLLMKANWNVHFAEDATSMTFMKAFENIWSFSTEKEWSSFVTRLYNIAYHSLIDILKRKEADRIDEENSISQDPDYVDYFQKHVQTEQILAYLEQLWSDKKDLFILRIWNNLSYDEIAEIMWKRSSTCRKDFSKLIKKVADHFKYRIDD